MSSSACHRAQLAVRLHPFRGLLMRKITRQALSSWKAAALAVAPLAAAGVAFASCGDVAPGDGGDVAARSSAASGEQPGVVQQAYGFRAQNLTAADKTVGQKSQVAWKAQAIALGRDARRHRRSRRRRGAAPADAEGRAAVRHHADRFKGPSDFWTARSASPATSRSTPPATRHAHRRRPLRLRSERAVRRLVAERGQQRAQRGRQRRRLLGGQPDPESDLLHGRVRRAVGGPHHRRRIGHALRRRPGTGGAPNTTNANDVVFFPTTWGDYKRPAGGEPMIAVDPRKNRRVYIDYPFSTQLATSDGTRSTDNGDTFRTLFDPDCLRGAAGLPFGLQRSNSTVHCGGAGGGDSETTLSVVSNDFYVGPGGALHVHHRDLQHRGRQVRARAAGAAGAGHRGRSDRGRARRSTTSRSRPIPIRIRSPRLPISDITRWASARPTTFFTMSPRTTGRPGAPLARACSPPRRRAIRRRISRPASMMRTATRARRAWPCRPTRRRPSPRTASTPTAREAPIPRATSAGPLPGLPSTRPRTSTWCGSTPRRPT